MNRQDYHKNWYANNKEYVKQYRKDNKEKMNATWKKYYNRNKDKIQTKKQEWRKSINGRFSALKATAKVSELEVLLTLEEYAEVISVEQCHYCDKPLPPVGYGLDRKNNELYYSKDNIVSCCERCNKTFMDNYTYKGKLVIAQAIKTCDKLGFYTNPRGHI